ncbi:MULTISPECIES: hypothetical protein [Pseudomonas]|jgi:hypothetical protein|uniref:Uncharacterized protein n=1 Tax=Pseudomonas quebecensis TaxID=2995174 RepID=A0ABY6QKL1_9PSED|nr:MULTISPECIES: hypothetical protein [Pseudomonas]MCP1512712.1 hypothetical protein [Pseudomonas rhodesiae]MCX4064697.1 hypothetical protein [Pseudomonas quebecensis]MDF9771562.1 hypothetical protein [Pseudomonas rhodesiae]UZW19451.1 hypothetical protein OSC50_03620 [Pseudomonas quebecensis]UZW23132.1 hypothetical protein OSC48_21860 [Pseudomonas quebecensis]
MQSSSTPASSDTGELIASFRHGKGFLIFSLIFGVALLALAAFVLYLGTILPPGNEGPVGITTSRGMTMNFSSAQSVINFTSGLLAILGLCVFGLYAWHKKLRSTSYEVYEHGIARINQGQREYTPFVEIQDLYLFSSGQTVMTGLITNLAYRRTAAEPFHRVIESLKGFQEFQQMVRELHVRARMPGVLSTLESGEAVRFNCISSGQVWGKRMSGNFLKITTAPILVSAQCLEYQGSKVPMSTLRSVDLNAWTEKVVVKDENGKSVLSTIATGILSHDLFLHTLDAVFTKEAQARELA